MKKTYLALVTVLLCGMLAACKQEPPAPAAEVTPPEAMEPAPTMPEPIYPGAPMPAEDAEEDDTPHSGGDRVGTGGGNQTGAPEETQGTEPDGG